MPANTKYDNTPLVDCTSQEEEEEETGAKIGRFFRSVLARFRHGFTSV